jgi:hypothetical protein
LDECCGACRYFKELVREIHTRDVLDGERVYKTVTTECRRHPASVGKARDEWCGEFARRGRGGVAGGGERATELDTATAPAPAPATEVRTVVLSEAMRRVLAAFVAIAKKTHRKGNMWYGLNCQSLTYADIHAVAREVEAAGVVVCGGDANGGAA